jgi:hypothetical protein
MFWIRKLSFVAALAVTAGVQAQTRLPSLASAHGYAVLGGSTVTNAGPSDITGDLGVSSPGITPTGFPPGTLVGTLHAGDPDAAQAKADMALVYGALTGAASTVELTGQDLGGRTLPPGVYLFSSSAQLTGDLILDAGDDPHAVFIFQIASTLTTATRSSVRLINQPVRSAADGSVFWQVGSSATIGTGTSFTGNILAHTSITMVSQSSISDGRAMAIDGAVTMDNNAISMASASYLLGDLNFDGSVDVSDAVLSLQFLVGMTVPSNIQTAVGEMDGNGETTVDDAVIILRIAAGL